GQLGDRGWSGELRIPIFASEAHPQAFCSRCAIVQQIQTGAARVSGQPADNDVASVNAEEPLLIRELAADLRCELAWVSARRRASPDMQIETRVGGGYDAEQEIAANEQIHQFAGIR